MKAMLFVLIWSSARPLMSSNTQLLPDMAACQKAAAEVSRTVGEASVFGGNIIARCVSLEP